MAQLENYLTPFAQVSDFHLANQPGAPFRTELNLIIAAIVSNNSGTTEPTSPSAGMFWLNTANTSKHILNRRNSGNTGWTKIYDKENPPTKAEVGLSLVQNYGATSDVNDASTTKYATAKAVNTLQNSKVSKTGQAYDSARLGGKVAADYALINGDYPNLRARATTKADVGLNLVENYGISDSVSLDSSAIYASAKAVKTVNDSKLPIAGKAADADLLDGLDSTAFARVSHTHTIAQVTDLQNQLDNKLNKTAKAVSASIADKWAVKRRITLGGNASGFVDLDGSENVTLNVTNNYAAESDTTTKLKTARQIALTGDVTGSANFDGSGNVSISATVALPVAGVPVGGVVMNTSATIPAGWLEMAGQTIQREQYPDLVTAIAGSGAASAVVPDMRGEFPRGFDNGRGVDSGRAINSAQEQSYQSHKHTGKTENHSHSYARFSEFQTANVNYNWGPVIAVPTNGWSVYSGTGNSSGGRVAIRMRNITTNLSSVAPALVVDNSGTEETRSRNVALMFIIRAVA